MKKRKKTRVRRTTTTGYVISDGESMHAENAISVKVKIYEPRRTRSKR